MAEKKNVVEEVGTVEAGAATAKDAEKKLDAHEAVPAGELLNDDRTEEEDEELYEGDALLSGVMLVREKLKPREKGAKPIYTYNVYGVVRGTEVRAGMMPPDKGGFQVLSLVFGEVDELPVWMVPYEMKDENGRKVSGFTYKVMSADEDGDVLECKIKPSRDSDKRILDCLIKKAQRTV